MAAKSFMSVRYTFALTMLLGLLPAASRTFLRFVRAIFCFEKRHFSPKERAQLTGHEKDEVWTKGVGQLDGRNIIEPRLQR